MVVLAVAIGLLGVPILLRLWPASVPYRIAFVVLPLVPGVALALVAIWYALRNRSS